MHLGEIATITPSSTPSWTIVACNGQPAISVEVYQQPEGNTVAIAAAVRARLAELSRRLPAEVVLRTWYDQSDLIRAGTRAVLHAVLLGIGLAAVVVLLALRQLRAALIAAITVPGALAGAVVGLHLIGQSLNLMTLGGMAAAVGLILDDAIVVVEYLARHLPSTDGATRRATVLAQARGLLSPMIGSTCASLVILLPLSALTGIAGSFFIALAVTMGLGLLMSLGIALTVLPLLMAWWGAPPSPAASPETGSRWTRTYARMLQHLVRWRWWVVGCLLPLATVGMLAERNLDTGFLPTVDEGGFTFDYRAPPGTSLERTDFLVRKVEAILRATPEVQTFSRRTGLQLGGGITEANEGDIFVRLRPLPRASIEEVMDRVRTQVSTAVPELDIDLSQQMEDLIGDLVGNPHPIEIELVGADGDMLARTARAVAAAITDVPGIVDVNDGVVVAGNAIEVHLDSSIAALHGLDATTIAEQLRTTLAGEVVATVPGVVELIGVRAVGPLAPQVDPDALAQVTVVGTDGAHVPLRAVSRLVRVVGQSEIDHHDLERVVAVTARIDDNNLGAAIARLQPILSRAGLIPSGIHVRLGGLYAQQQQAFHDLMGVLLAAIAALVVLLTALYRSLRLTLALMITATCSLAGVTMALWLTQTGLTITALMGLTMVVGIVTEVSILFASAIAALPSSMSLADRVVAAAVSRLRPILMTVAAAVLALLPLALAGPGGAELQRPLAIAIIGGLLLQLPLALLVLPMLVLVLRPSDESRQLV